MSNYDYTIADRQKKSRHRRAHAYNVIKDLAIELGAMSNYQDTGGLDSFVDLLANSDSLVDCILQLRDPKQ